MTKRVLPLLIIAVCGAIAVAQTAPKPTPTPAAQRPNTTFSLSDYGVQIQPDSRLIIMMAALDAAGYDPTAAGKEASAFRRLLQKDQVDLDPALRERLRTFYERNRLPAPATAADQAARYVSLAYVLSAPPLLDAPERSDDLPGGVLEVLDFAPLVKEFYRKSGIEGRLVSYMRAYQAEGDRLRQGASEMVRSTLSYLHTQPILITAERVKVKSPDKNNKRQAYSVRERERKFVIVPDLMAVPGVINFRVIADEYYAIVPEGTDPASSEMRRGYLQFVIDPLLLRFNKEIAAQREQVKQLIEARTKAGGTASPDVFIVVGRSLVAAADVRFEESLRLQAVTDRQRARLLQAKTDAERKAIAAEAERSRSAVTDEAIARLSDEYEKGSLLSFYFADQLRDFQSSGFDIANFFTDIVAGLNVEKENHRLTDNSGARERAVAARKAHPRYSLWLVDPDAETREAIDATRGSTLIKRLTEIEKLLQTKNYQEAETQLKALLQEYPGNVRLLFTLGQTASLWARDTTDDDLQTERLNRALANYRLAVAAANQENDGPLMSRAHVSMGRILAALDQKEEALKEFDAAIKLGDITGGAYRDALEAKRRLANP